MKAQVFDLGLVGFTKAYQFQKELFEQVKDGQLPAAVVLCQHYPVITLGRNAKKENIKIPVAELNSRGIAIHEIDRGGDVTYHGPGQLVTYPIFPLGAFKKDIHAYLKKLEEAIIRVLEEFGINGQKKTGLTGVWVGSEKIASLGIAVKNWISYHGFSLNIQSDDLMNFTFIRPCGMDIAMTSMESVLKRKISTEEVKESITRSLTND